MKTKSLIFALAALVAASVSCSREGVSSVDISRWQFSSAPEGAIVFGSGILAESKAVTEVTATTLQSSGFNVLGISSNGESYVNYINNVLMTNQGGDTYYNPSAIYYWPSAQTLDFYAVNPGKTIVGTNGVATVAHTLDAARGFDLVVASAYGKDSDDGKITMAFEHALSQVTLKLKSLDANADYKVTSVVFNAPKSGTYTIAQAGNSWTTLAAASDSTVFSGNMTTVNATTAVQVGDTFIAFPGTSTVTVSWATYVNNQLIAEYTESAQLQLQKGKRNAYTLKLPNADAQRIELSMSVNAWANAEEQEIVLEPAAYTFAGLQIAPGPLYYNGTSYEIKDNWNYSSYNTAFGKTEGSTYFSFLELGELFEKEGFTKDDGTIDNLLNPLDGWRLGTKTEWLAITSKTRSGATVNGTPNAHWAAIGVSGAEKNGFSGSSDSFGVLLFPDGKTITGKTLNGYDGTMRYDEQTSSYEQLTTENVVKSELNVYLTQGCVFIPIVGYRSDSSWIPYDQVEYWMNSLYGGQPTEAAECLTLSTISGIGDNLGNAMKTQYRPVYLVKPVE